MRKTSPARRTSLALLSTGAGVALLLGVKAQSAGAPRSALADAPRPAAAPSAAPPSSTSTAAPAPAAGSGSGTFTGSVVDTRYGPVQVQAVKSGGKLTDIVVLQQTYGGHSSQIDSYALPVLKSEALAAQSADIDVVSGATYTSEGYAQSLQAALDAAGK
ncbi:FMN-binding protein [Kitasatospora mediocidica]|uniref:FMN-binding protein n=1 Tax=Kitasatospora mediocidica TaxID=58352 RepID=UPI00056777EB|nr:FMN-binding protein [Kitasatospora mediocidica]